MSSISNTFDELVLNNGIVQAKNNIDKMLASSRGFGFNFVLIVSILIDIVLLELFSLHSFNDFIQFVKYILI